MSRLSLTDFRCYASADLRLAAGVSTFVGANGQGKTNLVEAAAYVATLGSHRVAADGPLVRRGAERAVLRAEISGADRESLVEIEINPGRANRARLNRSPVARPRQVLGVLRAVLFAPEDLALVKADPEGRRRFLDDLLVTSAPRYAGVRADYERVLRQRTALLKSLRGQAFARARARANPAPEPGRSGDGAARTAAPAAARTLEVWDEHLARAGAELLAARLRLTASLRPLVARAYAELSGDAVPASLVYRAASFRPGCPELPGGGPGPAGPGHAAGAGPGAGPAAGEDGPGGAADGGRVAAGQVAQAQAPGCDAAEPAPDREALAGMLREEMARRRAEELERGVCLVGPHRDDLELRIGGLPARGYASHGESWSMALALRLASYDLLRALGDDPVLLLDDVFAELDAGRRDRLAALVAGAEQVLVTAAVAADVPDALAGARFEVAGGRVSRVG